MNLLVKLKHCFEGKALSVGKEQEDSRFNYSGEIKQNFCFNRIVGLLNALVLETKRLIRNNTGLFRVSHPHSTVRRQDDFTAAAISLLKHLKFDALMGKLRLHLFFRLVAIVFLSMVILPLLSERSFAQNFIYNWSISGSPQDTILYVNDATPASDYPYVAGFLDETWPRRQTRAYLMWIVDNISTSNDWPTTDDVHINATKPGTNTDGENIKVCSGETLYVKKIDRSYGTWYFEARALLKENDDVFAIPLGEFRFWFCPKKSAFDGLNIGDYYSAYLNARGRRHNGEKWVDGHHHGDVKVTVIKTASNHPDLRWFEGDGWLKQIVADGSTRYDDLYGRIVYNSKPGHENVDSISAVQEKWLANGRSAGSVAASVGTQREEVVQSEWEGLENPLGDSLLYGTWYFNNNYRRFMFRPDAEAINRLLPGERVRSHATYSWVDHRCHSCPNRVFRSDTARVQIVREGVSLTWHENQPWTDNEIGKLRYDSNSPVSSVTGKTWIFLPSEGAFEVSASDSAATSNNGMPEALLSESSTDASFSTEYISDYGRWKWRKNNSGFEFVPDWAAINALGTGNSATTTLELKIVKNGAELSKAAVTISVHGTTPIVTIDDVTHAEGTGSADTEFQFTVRLSPPIALNQTFTVPVKFDHVTTDSADFVSGTANGLIDSGSLNLDFAATDIEKTITIQVNADSTGENEETFKLTLREPTGNAKDANLLQYNAALASTVGVGTIGDDDRGYLAIDDITRAEGADGETTEFRFTVSLSPATAVNQIFTVPITFAHVSTNNSDFMGDPTQTNYDLDFGAADTSKPVTISVNGDGGGEEVEQFTLTLSEPTGTAKEMNLVTLSADPDAIVGTGIIDNDDPKKLFTVWRNGYDGVIVSDGASQDYGYEIAYVGDKIPTQPSYSFTERKNGVVINSNSNAKTNVSQLNFAPYPDFIGTSGARYILSVKSTYGQWYRRRQQTGCAYDHCYHWLFVPNVNAINQLEHGDVVTSTLLRQTWHQGYDSGASTVTIRVDLGDEVIGFDRDSRSTEVLESESVSLGVSLEEARENPTTIPFEFSTGGSAELNADFMSPSGLSLTIPAGDTHGTISIPIINDTTLEGTESFTVTLLDGTDFTIPPAIKTATITIIDDDLPEIVRPGGKVCKVDTKPNEVATPNTEVYWKVGAPEVDDEPVVYRTAGDGFNVQLGFRDHATEADSTPNAHNTFYFGVYYADGTAENPGIPNFALKTDNHATRWISQPGAFRGYLRYRILPRSILDNLWYYVGEPCDFYIWWTDAARPGITMSIEQDTVPEGDTFRVVATATPPPNRDILVPFTISDESRVADSQAYNVLIRAGQAAGHRDIRTKFLASDQTADEVSVTADWTHNYWLDDTKKTASVAIEDHVREFVSFRSTDMEISVTESETANLVVELDRAHASALTVEFSVDDGTAEESVDFTEPAPAQITIPAGATQGTISIATISDDGNPEVEDTKSFTVTLTGSDNILPRNNKSVATVTILDDDRPVAVPGDAACHAVVKPAGVSVPNTEAYWNSGAPLVDGVPVVYREAGDDFDVRIGYRNPATKAESTPNHNTVLYFGVYYINGTPENTGVPNDMRSNQTGVNRTIGEPTNFRGYLRYRILARDVADQTWFHVGDPCEFHLWWTDANRPGVALSITEDSVSEGNLFRVTATATPAPNRDILVPISFSDTSRLADSPSRFVRIPAGESTGHAEILTKYLAGDQTANSIMVSTGWRSNFWLDESVKSDSIAITESSLPMLSISAGDTVTETENGVATFNVRSDNATGATVIAVNYTVTETGNFLRPPDPNNPALIGHSNNVARNATMRFTDRSEAGNGAGPYVHTLEIPMIDNDDLESGQQSITVTLNADTSGQKYQLSANSSASVTIIDDDTLPVLSFETEGNIAEFDEPNDSDTVKHITFMVTATAASNPGTLANVRYTPSETGNFIDDANGNTPDAPTQTTLIFTESNGIFTAPLEIPITADANPESTGSVSVTLLNAEGTAFHYKLANDADKHSWTVTVYDNDIPELTIAAPALQFSEGDSAAIEFAVTARFNVVGTMTVNFIVDEFSPSDFDTPLSPHTFVVSSFASPETLEFNGGTAAKLSVPITDDTDSEIDRVVRITLVQGNSVEYTVAALDSGGRAEITVRDDDSTVISVSAPESVKESDGVIEFTVNSLRDPGSPLDLSFALSEREGSDYLSAAEEARTSENLTLEDADGDGTFAKVITVNLTTDSIGEPTGIVTLKFNETPSSYRLDDASKTVMVKVYDDDVPEIRFGDDAGGGSVVEAKGAKAVFKVTASFMPSLPLMVHYTPVSANFLSVGSSGVKVSASLAFTDESANGEGPFTANLEVPIDDDDTTEDDGAITVTLNMDEPANETYTVDAQNNEAAVVIRDDDSLTTLTINGPESVLEDSGAVVFTIIARAPANPGDNYDVVYAVSQDGNFLNSRYSANPSSRQTEGLNFTAASGNFTANLTIDLDNDDTGEPTGSVKVRLEMNTGGTSDYVLGGRVEHTVGVYDDDAPLVWIETVEDNVVVETGAMSSFLLHSRSPLSTTISYRVGESSFIDATHAGMQTTTGEFRNLSGSFHDYTKRIDVPLLDGSAEGDALGEVTVTLLNAQSGSQPGYMVTTNDYENPASATVHVFNVGGDTPFAVVSSDMNFVTEGEEIVFKLSMIPPQTEDVRVRLQVSQQGDFIPWSAPDSVIVPPSGTELKIPTMDNDEVETGMVTVKILNGDGYRPGAAKSVAVTDNGTPVNKYSVAGNVIRAILLQIPPDRSDIENATSHTEISISSGAEGLAEGESAAFVISAEQELDNRISVNVRLQQLGNFVSGPMQRSVELAEGQSEAELVVTTENDELAEADGWISATIETGSGYRIGSQNTAHVAVSDAKDRQDRKDRVSGAVQSMLPNLLADSASESLRIVSARAEQSLHGDDSTSFELNGHSQLTKVLESGGEMLNAGEIDWNTVIDDSSFTVALHPAGEATSFATVWGFGDQRNHSGKAIGGQQSWLGESRTGHFGFDAAVGQGMLAGMAVSVADAALEYGSSGISELSIESLSTGVHPFMGFSTKDGRSRIQVTAGYGGNEFELKQEQYSPEILTGNFRTLGISGRSQIYTSSSFWEKHSLDLSLAGNAWHAQQSVNSATGLIDSLQLSARHVRISMDGQHSYHFAGGGTITPTLSVGLRGDGRNEEFASAMDLDSTVRFENRNGFTITGASKTLLASLNRLRNWEVSSTLDYDSDSDGKGVLFSISPSWHGADSDAERHIRASEQTGAANDSSGTFEGSLLAAEIGYGFEILDESAVLTPFHAFNRTQNHVKELRIGSRMETTTGIDFELSAIRETSKSSPADHELYLNGQIRW